MSLPFILIASNPDLPSGLVSPNFLFKDGLGVSGCLVEGPGWPSTPVLCDT